MTLDGEFVVRDLKLIEGANGLFVAMPSRKLTDKCPKCGGKNHLRARFCNGCGGKLDETRGGTDRESIRTGVGKAAKRWVKVRRCWSARTVVGTRTATCRPSWIALNAARSATSVLP